MNGLRILKEAIDGLKTAQSCQRGLAGGGHSLSSRPPSAPDPLAFPRYTDAQAKKILAEMMEARTRRDPVGAVALLLSQWFTDEQLTRLGNILGRIPHERKRQKRD